MPTRIAAKETHMNPVPTETNIDRAYLTRIGYRPVEECTGSEILDRFLWKVTYEGHDYWFHQWSSGPDEVAQAKLDEMERVYQDQRADLDTLAQIRRESSLADLALVRKRLRQQAQDLRARATQLELLATEIEIAAGSRAQ